MDNAQLAELKSSFEKLQKADKKELEKCKETFFNEWIKFANADKGFAFSTQYLCKAIKFNAAEKLYFWLKSFDSERQLEYITKITEYNYSEDSSIVLKLLMGLSAWYITDTAADSKILGNLLSAVVSKSKKQKDAYKWFLNYFVDSIRYADAKSKNIFFVDDIGLNYYAAKSFVRNIQRFIYEIKSNYKKLANDKIRKLFFLTVWLEQYDSHLIEPKGSENKIEDSGEATSDDLRKNIKDLKRKIKELEEKETHAKDEIIGLNNRLSEIARRLHASENRETLLQYDKRELNEKIEALNNSIKQKDEEIAERKNMNSAIASIEAHKTDEVFNKIAARLKIEYDELKEANDLPMTIELGEVIKGLLKNVFEKLAAFGIKMR